MIIKSTIDVSLIGHIGSDQHVIGAMRTLPDAPQPDTSDAGRIFYLMKHRHGTPFEHNCMIFNVHAPIFVWREWHRHRIGFSYNEESARYKQLDPVFYVPSRNRAMKKYPGEWKAQRPKFVGLTDYILATNSSAELGIDTQDAELRAGAATWIADKEYYDIIKKLTIQYAAAYRQYERFLAMNLDPGLARDCLPVGIYSSCWVTCNLRSALAFISLRTHDPSATYVSYPLLEIEEAARQIEAHVKTLFPLSYDAFVNCGRVGP